MRCGARRYEAVFVMEEEEKTKTVIARSPAEARKTLRANYGEEIYIKSVIKK